ncbi:MAG: hypothetical protein NTX25_16925 [Proteobacteria bacterium]|nr:hypothetical protein [Pseudomonadota bacterium]
MYKILLLILGLGWVFSAKSQTRNENEIKNLSLIGVIHVQGPNSASQSIAVVRNRLDGKTFILHKGDRIPFADVELSEFGPRSIILTRGTQQLVLEIEAQTTTSRSYASSDFDENASTSEEENPSEFSANELASSDLILRVPIERKRTAIRSGKMAIPRFEPNLIPAEDCDDNPCPNTDD